MPLDWDPDVLASKFGVILSDTAASEKSPRHIQILVEGAQWTPDSKSGIGLIHLSIDLSVLFI